jgi:hypothetical protein
MQKRLLFSVITAFGLLATLSCALADPGVSFDKIVFGQAAALEGPAAALGQDMRLGILAAFAEANKMTAMNPISPSRLPSSFLKRTKSSV